MPYIVISAVVILFVTDNHTPIANLLCPRFWHHSSVFCTNWTGADIRQGHHTCRFTFLQLLQNWKFNLRGSRHIMQWKVYDVSVSLAQLYLANQFISNWAEACIHIEQMAFTIKWHLISKDALSSKCDINLFCRFWCLKKHLDLSIWTQ